jgi:hypothetical protein
MVSAALRSSALSVPALLEEGGGSYQTETARPLCELRKYRRQNSHSTIDRANTRDIPV